RSVAVEIPLMVSWSNHWNDWNGPVPVSTIRETSLFRVASTSGPIHESRTRVCPCTNTIMTVCFSLKRPESPQVLATPFSSVIQQREQLMKRQNTRLASELYDPVFFSVHESDKVTSVNSKYKNVM